MKHYEHFINKSTPDYSFAKFTPTKYLVDEVELAEFQDHVGKAYRVLPLAPTGQVVLPKDDRRRHAKVYFICDVSGSVDLHHKEQFAAIANLVSNELVGQYRSVSEEVVGHHTSRVKDITTIGELLASKETGGSYASSGYAYVQGQLDASYDNYIVQLTDGDNWSDDDTKGVGDLIGAMLASDKRVRGVKYFEITNRATQKLGQAMNFSTLVSAYFMKEGSLQVT